MEIIFELDTIYQLLILLAFTLLVGLVIAIDKVRLGRLDLPACHVQAEIVARRRWFHWSISFPEFGHRGSIFRSKRSAAERRQGYAESTTVTRTVTFLTDDGKRIRLFVTEHDYVKLSKGLRGELTYKGRSFLDFKRRE